MNKNTLSVIIFIAVIILLATGLIYVSRPDSPYKRDTLDAFAQCLASKKITMYGAEWCSHCKAEKARFGSSFKYVPYVECPENQKLCLDKGVKGYPTWITESGEKYAGEQGLEKLAEITSCPLVE